MAVHWNQISKVVPFPDDSIAGDPNRNFDWRALAHVVRGVLDLAGLKFDDYGRLASARATERPAGKALCCCVYPASRATRRGTVAPYGLGHRHAQAAIDLNNLPSKTSELDLAGCCS